MPIIENMTDAQDIHLTSTISVENVGGPGARVSIPAELRITEQLIGLINNSLLAQGLELKHMDIAEVHKKDLKGLPNVVLEEKEEKR